MTKKVLILAGGGGHTGYGYALAQSLNGVASLSFLVPKGDALSHKRLSKFGTVGFLIKSRGARTPTSEFIPNLAMAFLHSYSHISREYDVVVSTGSNFCVPPAFFAWMKGIPLVNIESPVRFTQPSKSARLLHHFSTVTAIHWDEQQRLFPDGVVVGPILPKPEITVENKGYILVAGGTYGHKLLFDAVADSTLRNVVLQTGRINPKSYANKHPEWTIVTLTQRFDELLAGADVVVTHFGVTVLEAVVYGKPVVLVPNPEWTRTAGIEDAKHLAQKLNAVLVSEITTNTVLNAIDEARERTVPTLLDGAKNLAISLTWY